MNNQTSPELPHLPLPEPLRGCEPDSFAQDTITRRLPGIARTVLEAGDWSAEIADSLGALIDEMPDGSLRPVHDDGGPDVADWASYIAPYQGQNWLDAPWFIVETYFFRRILEATGYFQPGLGHGLDPYASQKREALSTIYESVLSLCAQLEALDAPSSGVSECQGEELVRILRTNLWGNQADLSMWPASGERQPDRPRADELADHLLVDHSCAASRYLASPEGRIVRVDFVLDNVGLELAYDLALADYLLGCGLAQQVRFHLKPYPTYVSDATLQDVLEMLSFLGMGADPLVRGLAQRLEGYLAGGMLLLERNYYWVSPLSGWEMPSGLRDQLSRSELIISKGDANYRRWMGDRQWPFTAPLYDVLVYQPAPMLLLRVLKANLAVGLQPGQPEEMDRKDPRWLYNGKWGLIQFNKP